MASRLLGLARDWVFLTAFGAGHVMDAYNVAFRLPNLVRDLFAEGAMSAAFVPTFTRELHTKGKDAAWELGRIVITGLIVVTGIITVAGILLAGPLTAWIAPEYAATPGKLELTTTLTQVMFPFLVLIAIAVACMGMLNSLRSFFLPALAPAAFNVACIASAFVIVPFMPMLGWHAMVGLAIGTLLGGVAQVALQWPALVKEGFRFRPQFGFSDPRFREIVRLMIPGTLGLAAAQVNQLVNVYLATSEGEGAVTYLGFAFRLMYLPIGLFGVSIATAAIPGITRHAAADDMEGVRNDVSQALRMMLMLNMPATFGLIVLAGPIVELLVEYRNVNAHNTAGIAAALMGYAPGLVGYSAVKIASPTFYALKDSRTPVTIGMICIALNVALNLLLVRTSLSYAGLALGHRHRGARQRRDAVLDAAPAPRRARRSARGHGAGQGAGGLGGDGGRRLGRRARAGAALGRQRTVAPRRPRRPGHRPRPRHAGPDAPGCSGCTNSRSRSGGSGAASPAGWPSPRCGYVAPAVVRCRP